MLVLALLVEVEIQRPMQELAVEYFVVDARFLCCPLRV